QMLLECRLIKVDIIKGPKLVAQPTEHADQAESTRNDINCETKPRLLRKCQDVLRLALCVTERLSCCKKILNEIVSTISCKSKITTAVSNFNGAAYQIPPGSQVSRPRHDIVPKAQIGASSEAVQPTLLNQVVAELPETEPGPILPKTGTGNDAEPDIS